MEAEAAYGNADLPFAKELFEAADRMRGSVESAEYKHLVLGLLLLKYISESFERRRAWLEQASADPANEDYFTEGEEERRSILEDRDEYVSENVFWVPPQARFDTLLAAASQPDIGERVDRALETIARIGFGDDPDEARDVLGRTYKYFIREFARKEGHRGGEFYTPRSVTKLLVEMLEPFKGRVLDPAWAGDGGDREVAAASGCFC